MSQSINFLLECTNVESTFYKHWYFTVLIISQLDIGWTLYIYCRIITLSTVGLRLSQLFPNIVQTLVFHSRLLGLNRHWIDHVHLLSENYFFHSRIKVGPIVYQHCTTAGSQQLISYIRPTFNQSSQSAECHDFCLGG